MSKGILHSEIAVECLVVAGGGGGGMDMGGGGGAGGYIHETNHGIVPGTPYSVTVGAGGTGAPAAGTSGQPSAHQYTIPANNGANSVFDTLTAIGGGAGGSSYYAYTPESAGSAGGSGGGGSGYSNGAVYKAGGAATSGQGNVGGRGGPQYYSGGGGGAGAQGTDSTGLPHGGIGIENDILGTSYYWAGGGGGAGYTIGGGNGGLGGGGGGAVLTTTGGTGYNNGQPGGGGTTVSQTNTPGGDAGANTGGGGGGGSHYNSNNKGGDGGSGIVVIRYKGPVAATGGTITSVEGDTVHTFLSSDTFTYTGLGASWEFWYKKNAEGYTDSIIFCKENFCQMGDIGNDLKIAVYTDTWAWIDTTFNVVVGTIYHVVATYDGANIKVYVNGDLKLTSAKTGVLNYNDNPYKLNSKSAVESTSSLGGNHTFYIFRIYSRALNSAEIRNNYNNEKTLFGL